MSIFVRMAQQLVSRILLQLEFPKDSGPVYTETLPGSFPVEPFNTFSNIIFLAIVIYFGVKIYNSNQTHKFLGYWVLPILFIGYVGGTLYHGLRSHEAWLLMDYVPILVLTVSAVFYFIFKFSKSWWRRLLLAAFFIGGSFGLRFLPFPVRYTESIGYIITAVSVLLPICLYLFKVNFKHGVWVALSAFTFALAVMFRISDRFEFLSMGTHWLWHLAGGTAVFFMFNFIYLDRHQNVNY